MLKAEVLEYLADAQRYWLLAYLEVEGRYLHAGGAQMFGRFRHKRSARFTGGLAVGLLVLCALFTAGARAQSAPPPKPSGGMWASKVRARCGCKMGMGCICV